MEEGVRLGEEITFPQGQEGTERTGQDGTRQDMTGQDRKGKHKFVQAGEDQIGQDRTNYATFPGTVIG